MNHQAIQRIAYRFASVPAHQRTPAQDEAIRLARDIQFNSKATPSEHKENIKQFNAAYQKGLRP